MSSSKTPFYQHLLLSTSAASLAELVTLPIDTVKVHLQSNVTKVTPSVKNPILHSMKHVYYNQGGIAGFYRSWLSATTRQCLSSGSRIGLYAYFRDTIQLDKHPTYPKLGAVAQGSLCGLISSTLALPADVIKTRIQSSHHPITTCQAIREVYHPPNQPSPKGICGFYRGFNQTALRAITISSIQLPLYFGIQDSLQKSTQPRIQQLSLNQRTAISSILTTIGVTLVVYPIDLCKTQVQNSHHQTAINLIKSIFVIHRNPLLLYRGLLVGITRSLPHFWLTTTIYENLKSFAQKKVS